MKLKITKEMWGINSRTGKSSVKETVSESFPCEKGELKSNLKSAKRFTIDSVKENSVTVTMHCNNEKYNKTWIIAPENGVFHRPLSMDGGYQYRLEIVK